MYWRNNNYDALATPRPTPPSRKVGVATANKMAAWKRDKVMCFLARRIKQRWCLKTSQELLEGRENLYKSK